MTLLCLKTIKNKYRKERFDLIKNKLIVMLLLFSLLISCMGSALAAPKGNESAPIIGSEVIAEAEFGNGVNKTGFENVTTGTGTFKTDTKKSINGLSLTANASSNDAYVYFNFDNDFAYQTADGSVFDFEITYYSEKSAFFEFVYDSIVTESIRGKLIEVGNDQEWKTTKITVDDAYFGERLKNNSDFYISALTAGTSIHNGQYTASPANPVIKSVKVTRHVAQKPITLFAETHESGNTFEFYKETKTISNSITNSLGENVDVNITYKAVDQNHKTRWQQTETLSLKAGENVKKDINVDTQYCSIYNYIVEFEIPSKGIKYEYNPFEFAIVKSDPNGVANDYMYWCTHNERLPGQQQTELMEMVKKSNSIGIRTSLGRHQFGPVDGSPVFPEILKSSINAAKNLDLKIVFALGYWSPWLKDESINSTANALNNVDGFKDSTKQDMYAWFKSITDEAKDVMAAYEIWNEPNLKGNGFVSFDSTSKGYYQMAKAYRECLSKLDPEKPLLAGSYADGYSDYSTVEKNGAGNGRRFHELLVDLGISDYVDGFTHHPYNVVQYEDDRVLDIFNWYHEYAVEKSGKKNLTEWVTEVGNCIMPPYVNNEEMQAYKNVRECLVNRSDMVYFNTAPTCIYNLERKATTSAREDTFGNVAQGHPKMVRKNARGFVPYDGYVSLTAMNYVLGNADFVKYDRTEENMWIELFNSKKFNKNVSAIWYEKAEAQKTFDFGCDELTVFDPYGNETKLKSSNGKYTFTVSQIPFYVMGDFSEIKVCDTVETKLSNIEINAAQGDVMRLEVTKDNAADGSDVKLDVPDFITTINNEPFKNGKVISEYSLAADFKGTVYIDGTVNENGEPSQYIRIRLNVSEAIEATVSNSFPGGKDYNVWNMVFDITNKSLSNVARGKIHINSPTELKGDYDFNIGNVLKGKTSRITVSAPDVLRKQLYYLDYDIILDNGAKYNFSQQLDFTIAPKSKGVTVNGKIDKDEWDLSTAMIADSAENVRMIPDWAGVNDLSGYTMMQWDDEKLYLFASVTDDTFSNPNEPKNLWAGDSLQFAVYNPEYAFIAMGEGTDEFNEIGIALLKDGPSVYKFKDQYNVVDALGEIKDCEVAVVRNETTKTTNYEFAISWKTLFGKDMEYKAGDRIGYSVMYNDDDGQGRRGWIEYASGIGESKNRKLFAYLNLVD